MPMSPSFRKLALLVHIATSVAWPGTVAAFLALAITGLNSENAQIVRSSYLIMPFITWYVIVPLAFTALVSGLILSLGTKWGLFRYYWVLAKFLINSLSVPILLLHTQVIRTMANAAATGTLSHTDLHDQRAQLVTIAIAALLALLAATVLSVYKPRGITSYGQRVKRAVVDCNKTGAQKNPLGGKWSIIADNQVDIVYDLSKGITEHRTYYITNLTAHTATLTLSGVSLGPAERQIINLKK